MTVHQSMIQLCQASVIAISAATALTPAIAQEQQSAAIQPSPASSDVNDIVVTARRKTERLIDVPAAITVISTETMRAKGITNPTDLIQAVPSLQQSASGAGNATPHFVIRGQRQQLEHMTVDQSVGVYVDEIAVLRQQGLNAGLFDMANVQVLKGPQGTLFGKNQTGGAILFSSQTPQEDFGGYVSAAIGNYNARRIEGALNVPITEDLQIRAAGQLIRRNGYLHNVTDGRDYNDAHTDGWRVSIHYAPGAGILENWLIFGGAKQQEIGTATKQLPEQLGLPGVGTTTIFSAFGNPAGDALMSAAIQSQARSYGKWEVGGVSAYQLPNGRNIDTTNFYVTNKTEFHLSDNATIRNIFGYRYLRSYPVGNYSTAGFLLKPGTTTATTNAGNLLITPPMPQRGAPVVPVPAGNVVCGPQSGVNCVLGGGFSTVNFVKQRQVSDELSVLGTLFDNKLDYIIGLYYLREHGTVVASNFVPVANGSRMGTSQNQPVNESRAIFTQATYHVTPTISLTGGLRQTWDKRFTNARSVTIVPDYWPFTGGIIPADGIVARCALVGDNGVLPNNTPTNPDNCLLSGSAKFNQLTYTASVDWHPTPEMLLYAATRRGYRSGGFNQSATFNLSSNPTVLTPFQPETVTDYELGFKGDWRLGNGMTAGFNLALYHNVYENIQRALTSAAGNKLVVANAASAKIDGIEVEARASPTGWLDISAYYSYIRPRFNSFVVTNTALYSPSSIGDFTKSKFSGVPTHSGGATVTAHHELNNRLAQLEQCFWKRHFCSMTCTHRRECYHYIFGFG